MASVVVESSPPLSKTMALGCVSMMVFLAASGSLFVALVGLGNLDRSLFFLIVLMLGGLRLGGSLVFGEVSQQFIDADAAGKQEIVVALPVAVDMVIELA